jgi:tol-pal system protein YbgF
MKFRAALLLGLFATLPAQAGLFSDDEARQQVVELRKTVDALSKRIDGATQNQLDFSNQVEALRTAVAHLTGQVEVLTNSLEAAHKRQQDFYVDLDNRLRKLEATSSPEAGPASATSAASAAPSTIGESKSDPQAEMREYEAALSLSSAGKFKEAQAAFQKFITAHPKSSQLPSANYWLGHSLYQQKLYGPSATAFGRVAASWPNDAKAPDAMLAQANALVSAQDVKGAIKVLETLVEKYPTSPVVETARSRLKTLAPKKK